MKKIIVTGAGGFLGGSFCKVMMQKELEVYAVVHKQSDVETLQSLNNNEHLHIVYCDMKDYNKLPQRIDDEQFDVFYHFAWAGTAGNQRSDYQLQMQNAVSTANAARMAQVMKCQKFVYAASVMEYELLQALKNKLKINSNFMYHLGKFAGNVMTQIICDDLGLNYNIAIISNIYGPGETSPRFINTTIRKLLHGEKTAFTKGEQLYDFIYIDDAVKAFEIIGSKGLPQKTYYVGNLKPRPLREFLSQIQEVLKPKNALGIGELPDSGIEIPYDLLPLTDLYHDTLFLPKVSFGDGIRLTSEWLKSL